LAISDNSALGSGAVTLGNAASSSAALNVSGLISNPDIANNITVSPLSGSATATIASFAGPSSGTNQFSGNVILNGSVAIDSNAQVSNSLKFSGTISGNGGVTINPGLHGAVNFTGANSYNGNTTVQSGTFFANNTSGSATGNGNVIANNGAILAGTGSMAGVVSVNSGRTWHRDLTAPASCTSAARLS
jgi:hypothetical protein